MERGPPAGVVIVEAVGEAAELDPTPPQVGHEVDEPLHHAPQPFQLPDDEQVTGLKVGIDTCEAGTFGLCAGSFVREDPRCRRLAERRRKGSYVQNC